MPTVIRPSINGMSHQSVRPARRERRRCDHSSPRALSSACSSRNSRYVMSKEDVSIPVADAAESRTHFGSAIQSRTTLMNVSRWFTVGRTTEGFYDTRPRRSGRCKCHDNLTKGSRLEQRARVCPKGLCVKTMLGVAELREKVSVGGGATAIRQIIGVGFVVQSAVRN